MMFMDRNGLLFYTFVYYLMSLYKISKHTNKTHLKLKNVTNGEILSLEAWSDT